MISNCRGKYSPRWRTVIAWLYASDNANPVSQISIDTSDGTWGFSNHIPRDKATAYEGLVELTSDHSNLDHLIRTQPDAAARRNINVNLLRVRPIISIPFCLLQPRDWRSCQMRDTVDSTFGVWAVQSSIPNPCPCTRHCEKLAIGHWLADRYRRPSILRQRRYFIHATPFASKATSKSLSRSSSSALQKQALPL